MPKQVRAFLIAVGVIVAAVVPGGFVVPAIIALIIASRRKSQPAVPTKEQ